MWRACLFAVGELSAQQEVFDSEEKGKAPDLEGALNS